jgi:hypothetical protein
MHGARFFKQVRPRRSIDVRLRVLLQSLLLRAAALAEQPLKLSRRSIALAHMARARSFKENPVQLVYFPAAV